jgi:hypothetical protein
VVVHVDEARQDVGTVEVDLGPHLWYPVTDVGLWPPVLNPAVADPQRTLRD